jgi:uncharacterized protein YndB with AHSA1/START domain
MKSMFVTACLLAIPPLTSHAAGPDQRLTDRAIRISRTVACPVDTAWWKWTTHEGLKTFLGEDNMMELRIGGPFEIYFAKDAPAGQRGSEGCKVISYLPKEMFSFSWNAPPSFPDIRNGDHHTWVVITMKPVKGNATTVTINHLGWLEGKDWDQVYAYFDKAWVHVMDSLEESCKPSPRGK